MLELQSLAKKKEPSRSKVCQSHPSSTSALSHTLSRRSDWPIPEFHLTFRAQVKISHSR